MKLRHMVESYKFWDVVTLWAKETLENEEVVARALSRGIIRDGLKFQSVDMKWFKDKKKMEFRGYPYVGYFAEPGGEMIVIVAEVLEHLLSIVREAKTPSRRIIRDEFVFREDFKHWIEKTGQSLPVFWFPR